MSDLDKRLFEILDREMVAYDIRAIDRDDFIRLAIALAEQAFIDDGWVDYRKEFTMWSRTMSPEDYMTGQEFYDRFEQEVEQLNGVILEGNITAKKLSLEAARKAAGIE